ncbi:MAG: HesA/MoeB/ThiF family protein [Bacteroidetes bacterium]|nr:HesA/MoeB/ThiF family protein [Bacteroidota bacterium]
MKDYNKYERYQRQVILKELGISGQEKLLQSKILVVGAGGLGCPALQYLSASGIGTIGIIDFDTVELSNLHRQTLYCAGDTGKPKAVIAAQKLHSFNPDIEYIVHNIKLENTNALEIISNYDLVVDGTDNFSTRYLVNDACVLLNKPLVYGAVLRYEGQVGVFNLSDKSTTFKTNYRDLFPTAPASDAVLSCNEAGVLGVLPGIIGTMQAAEAIKICSGIGNPLSNKILSFNLLTNLFYEFNVLPRANSTPVMPKNELEFLNFDYDWFCGANQEPFEISVNDFEILRKNENLSIVDVRETGELPEVSEFSFYQIPLNQFKAAIPEFLGQTKTVLFCQSGKRSLIAAKLLKERFPECSVYSLKGGIEAWRKYFLKLNTTSD